MGHIYPMHAMQSNNNAVMGVGTQGQMGSVSWPPWKMDEKLKNENMQKRAVFSVYVIFWEQSGQADVQNGAMLAVVKFSKFSSSQAARGINPLTKILRTFWMQCIMCFVLVCTGTSFGLRRTGHAGNWSLRRYMRLYENCVYIDGNLEITYLENGVYDLSFLSTIQEVKWLFLFVS